MPMKDLYHILAGPLLLFLLFVIYVLCVYFSDYKCSAQKFEMFIMVCNKSVSLKINVLANFY